jgi:hypothetical protein
MEIWNGLTPIRQDLGTIKSPGHDDYLVIVQKIQELQTYFLDWTNNLQLMPNLNQALQEAQSKIEAIQRLIDNVTLPKDVLDRLNCLENFVNEVDQRVNILQLRRDFDSLREKVTRNQIEVLQLQSSFATEVKGFQNKVWGILEKIQKDTAIKLNECTEKMQHLDAQLDLQASLEKFHQLNK